MNSNSASCRLSPSDYNKRHSFQSSFVVDARGGELIGGGPGDDFVDWLPGSRDQVTSPGVRIIIPRDALTRPTRLTCKLVDAERVKDAPLLPVGQEYVTRFLQLDPPGITFNRTVFVQIPHVAGALKRTDGAATWRTVTLLRTDDGHLWREQPSSSTAAAMATATYQNHQHQGEFGACFPVADGSSVVLATTDFPRFFVAVSRVVRHSMLIGCESVFMTSSVAPGVRVDFPLGCVSRNTTVSIQVVPVSWDRVRVVTGVTKQILGTSAVLTIEPIRRKFHRDVTVTLPLPQPISAKKDKQSPLIGAEQRIIRLFYSLTPTETAAVAVWEDISDVTTLHINDSDKTVSFSTNVSARFWLLECVKKSFKSSAANTSSSSSSDALKLTTSHVTTVDIPSLAAAIYRSVLAVPMSGRFVVFGRRQTRHAVTSPGETVSTNHSGQATVDQFELCIVCCVSCDTASVVRSALDKQRGFQLLACSGLFELISSQNYTIAITTNPLMVNRSARCNRPNHRDTCRPMSISFRAFRDNRLSLVVTRPPRDLDRYSDDGVIRITFQPEIVTAAGGDDDVCSATHEVEDGTSAVCFVDVDLKTLDTIDQF